MNVKLLAAAGATAIALFAPAAHAIDVYESDEATFGVEGYIQPYFRWVENPCTYPEPGRCDAREVPDGFGLTRARLAVTGDFRQRGSFKLELRTVPNASLLTARVDFDPLPWLHLTIGRFRVPFSRQELTSESRLQLIDRAALIRGTPGRQLGFAVQTQFGFGEAPDDLITLSGGIFNGESAKEQAPVNNIDEDFLFAARLEIAPWGQPSFAEGDLRSPEDRRVPQLSIGANWTYNTAGESAGDFEHRNIGADIAFWWQGLSLYGEVYRADRDFTDDDLNTDYNAFGWNVQAGYFIPAPYVRERLEVVGRVEEYDPQRAHDPDRAIELRPFNSGTGPANSNGTQASRNYVAGLNWYFFEHDLKLQVNYTHRQGLENTNESADNPDVPLDVNDDTIFAQLTFRF